MGGVVTRSLGLVLDLAPDLGAELEEEDWEEARLACTGEVLRLQPGRWEPSDVDVRGARCGWVVVDGAVCRETVLGEHRMIELLGPGDVVGLPAAEHVSGLGAMVSMMAASDVVLLGLGTPFLRAAQRWPSLLWTLLARGEAQRERVTIQGLIGHFPRAETRVLLMLWHLAQRWGRVTPEGVVLPIALTHALLGELTGARRSTVTLGVSALESQGLIGRARTGFWVISAAGERVVRTLVEPGAPTQPLLVGDGELLRERAREIVRGALALRAQARQTQANGPHGQGRPVPGPRRVLGAVADADGIADTAGPKDPATDRTACAKRARRAAEDAALGAGTRSSACVFRLLKRGRGQLPVPGSGGRITKLIRHVGRPSMPASEVLIRLGRAPVSAGRARLSRPRGLHRARRALAGPVPTVRVRITPTRCFNGVCCASGEIRALARQTGSAS